MSRLDDLLIFDDACAVTLFDMHVQLHRDGRERGIWFRLQDTSEERAAAYEKWVEDRVTVIAKMFGFDDDKTKRFQLYMRLDSEIKPLLNTKTEETALLEWDEVLRAYNAIGNQLRKAGRLPPLPRSPDKSNKKPQRKKARRA